MIQFRVLRQRQTIATSSNIAGQFCAVLTIDWSQGSEAKVYPDSIENEPAPYWFAEKIGARPIKCEAMRF